ncbi:unnamed protein product [Amaranthus hypochondriacus]
MRVEEASDEGGAKTKCNRKLFFSKKLSCKANLEGPTSSINKVTSLLDKVAIGNDDVGLFEEIKSPTKELNDTPWLVPNNCGDKSLKENVSVEGDKEHVGKEQDPTPHQEHVENEDNIASINSKSINLVAAQNISLTRKRVQKWKKLARECPSQRLGTPQFLPVGEKRLKDADMQDEDMLDDHDRGNFKKRIVPMEVDSEQPKEAENVASPTRWALGAQ